MASDRIKRATEWFYKMLYREEKITPCEKTAIPEKHVSVVKTPSRPKQERKREFDITLDFSEPTSFQELIPAVTTVLLPKACMRGLSKSAAAGKIRLVPVSNVQDVLRFLQGSTGGAE